MRRSLGVFNESQLRWMFRYAKITWNLLLQASFAQLISHYGITIKERTKKPEPNPQYPSKKELALQLLDELAKNHPEIQIQTVFADALYGNAEFMDKASKITSCAQLISQLRTNQLVRNRNRKNTSLKTYFSRTEGVKTKLIIRGGAEKDVILLAARSLRPMIFSRSVINSTCCERV